MLSGFPGSYYLRPPGLAPDQQGWKGGALVREMLSWTQDPVGGGWRSCKANATVLSPLLGLHDVTPDLSFHL